MGETPAVGRPSVSVIVPFAGDDEAAARLAGSLVDLRLADGDELIVADNSELPAFGEFAQDGWKVVRATGEHSSYHARNRGAAVATGEWLLFTDADCVPAANLIEAYLADVPDDEVGALAGAVVGEPEQDHFLARYAVDRGLLDQGSGLHTAGEAAATANLMIRRRTLSELGGFIEGIRSGGDVDLCRRLVSAGWRIDRRPGAVVRHLHRESLADLMGSYARYAAGASWLNKRYPGTAPAWPLAPGLVHCARDIAANLARLRFEQAAFRGVDALGMFAHTVGYRRSNAAG
ncbi:hypothetical protein BH24ACT23_BH24ACT23_01490 [soil metagenome]